MGTMSRFAAVFALSLACAPWARAQDFSAGLGTEQDFIGRLGDIQNQAAEFSAGLRPQMTAPKLPPAESDALKPYTVRGIDISHYQGEIEWDQVRGQGISFIYMKATQGDSLVDEEFSDNWASAAGQGVARGAYLFYDFCKPAAAQAKNFIQNVPADPEALPPAVDFEIAPHCATLPSKKAFGKIYAALKKKLEQAYGKAPILYMPYSLYAKYLKGAKSSAAIWIRDVGRPPQTGDWALWQYADRGTVGGIAGEVDLDVLNGGPEALAALIKPSASN